MSLAEYMLKKLNAVHILPQEASGLYDAMQDVANELKIPMPKIHVIPTGVHAHPVINCLANTPNAASVSREHIILTKPLLEMFHCADLTQPISAELKAVLAHEMHHSANRASMMAMSRLPVLALPVVAVAATWIYDRAHAKAKKQGDTSPQNVVGHADAAAEELRDSLPTEAKESGFFRSVVHYGKYFAVAAIGLGAGLMAARYGARHHEFAADIMGSKSAGKEAMISALKKLHEAMGRSISEHPEAKKFKGIMAETIQAHPSFAERVANIRQRG